MKYPVGTILWVTEKACLHMNIAQSCSDKMVKIIAIDKPRGAYRYRYLDPPFPMNGDPWRLASDVEKYFKPVEVFDML